MLLGFVPFVALMLETKYKPRNPTPTISSSRPGPSRKETKWNNKEGTTPPSWATNKFNHHALLIDKINKVILYGARELIMEVAT